MGQKVLYFARWNKVLVSGHLIACIARNDDNNKLRHLEQRHLLTFKSVHLSDKVNLNKWSYFIFQTFENIKSIKQTVYKMSKSWFFVSLCFECMLWGLTMPFESQKKRKKRKKKNSGGFDSFLCLYFKIGHVVKCGKHIYYIVTP